MITALFSGSGHKVKQTNTLVHLLNEYINTDISNQKIMAFDGCAETHGISGAIFGTGLDEQCDEVIDLIAREIKKGNTVTLNVYGHSRGAIGALLLAKQLGKVDPNVLDINLALLDPVPGNFITTSTLDMADISLAKKTMDLSDCEPLKNVLVLYPHQPLPTLSAHAPLVCLYPEHTRVEEDVIAGCHANAQFQDLSDHEIVFTRPSFITFVRIFQFLKAWGSEFNLLPALRVRREYLNIDVNNLDEALIEIYIAENDINHEQSYRDCHSATGLRIDTKRSAEYFNLHHQRLALVPADKSNVRVSIEENHGPIAQIKRAILHFPTLWQALKWSVLSIGLASLIVLTGGLAAIPLLAGITAKLGLLSIFALAPIVGGVLYTLFKPLGEWAINRFFYPRFQMRDIPVPTADANDLPRDSSLLLVRALGVTHHDPVTSASLTNNVDEPEFNDDDLAPFTVVVVEPDEEPTELAFT